MRLHSNLCRISPSKIAQPRRGGAPATIGFGQRQQMPGTRTSESTVRQKGAGHLIKPKCRVQPPHAYTTETSPLRS